MYSKPRLQGGQLALAPLPPLALPPLLPALPAFWPGRAPTLGNPQPRLPAALPTAGPEQTAPSSRPAQHPEAQSALDRQAPVMNCKPLPLPTFLAPAGSPTAKTVRATVVLRVSYTARFVCRIRRRRRTGEESSDGNLDHFGGIENVKVNVNERGIYAKVVTPGRKECM